MTRLVVIRHGNTFAPGEAPRRIGRRTDLPLVESGRKQALTLAQHFKERDILPAALLSSPLKRAEETAGMLAAELGIDLARVIIDDRLSELDYGPDEGCFEEEVIARIGSEALEAWDQEARVPPDWVIEPETIRQDWRTLSQELDQTYAEKTVFLITSNGTARFALALAEASYDGPIKLRTGAYGMIEGTHNAWRVVTWNVRPD